MSEAEPSGDSLFDFYLARFHEHGISEQGVGWGPKNNQAARFRNITQFWDMKGKRVLDIGAGTADLFAWLTPYGIKSYIGLEVMPFYCDAANQRFNSTNFEMQKCDIYSQTNFPATDYGVASGTFYMKTDDDAEKQYLQIASVFQRLKTACTNGFAANFLSDSTTFRDETLFYAKSERILEIARGLSRRVILSHMDFPFEFTVYVWVDDRFDSTTARYAKTMDS